MTRKGQEKMSNPIARASDDVTICIDISKDNLDACLHPEGIARQFRNDRKGHAQLIAWARLHQPARIVFEATGRYHRALELALGKAGLPAVKVNPPQARRFAEATGKRVKTDPIDAVMLARFGAIMRPEIPPAKDETHAFLSGGDRGQAPKPRSGASKRPGLRPVAARGTMEMAVLVLTRHRRRAGVIARPWGGMYWVMNL
jgi:transposase